MAVIRQEQCSIDAYHASDAISHSKLRDFAKRGPRYYHQRYVSRALPGYDTDALRMGRAFEDMLCRPDAFEALYAVRPDGLDGRTKDGKAWLAANAGKTVLSADDVATLREMCTAVHEHRIARELLANAEEQVTYTTTWGGLPGLQSRPDWSSSTGLPLTAFRPYCLDLKTTADLNQMVSARSVLRYGYHTQAALAKWCMAGNGIEPPAYFFLVVEKQLPHRVQVMELDTTFIARGWDWCAEQLTALERHYTTNEWPRCDERVILLEPPAWMDESNSEEDAA